MALNKLVAGNWKMHGVASDLQEVKAAAEGARRFPSVDVALCVPATLIERAARGVSGFAIGAQDVHFAEKGAHTGCASAAMLMDAGASLTIVGHSERRDAQRERDADVKAKTEAALAAGLGVILCVGESLEVREAGDAVAIVDAQLEGSLPGGIADPASLSVAYEPIWAISTGKVASRDDIAGMHAAVGVVAVRAFDLRRDPGVTVQIGARHDGVLAIALRLGVAVGGVGAALVAVARSGLVDLAVAVVVDAVAQNVGRGRFDRRIPVIAVLAAHLSGL